MEKHNKIKKHIKESKRLLDLFYEGYENDLNDEIYENIITAIDEIIDALYGAQLKAIELDEIMEKKKMIKIIKDLLNEYLDANVRNGDGFNADYGYERFIKKYDKIGDFSDDEKDEIIEYLNRLEQENE